MSGNINFNGWINDDGSENYKCRAWVNFNGQGTVAIRAAGNVSSITDIGSGDYIVNFAVEMPDTNYSALGTWSTTDPTWDGAYLNAMVIGGTRSGGSFTAYYTTTQLGVCNYAGNYFVDVEQVNIAIFR